MLEIHINAHFLKWKNIPLSEGKDSCSQWPIELDDKTELVFLLILPICCVKYNVPG